MNDDCSYFLFPPLDSFQIPSSHSPLLFLFLFLFPSQSLLATCSQFMAAAADAAVASEVCAPTVGATNGKGTAIQAWKVVVGWMCFLLQVVLQILRGTPSWAQLLSYVGLRHPLLSSSSTSAATSAAASIPFVPLSTEEVPTDTPPPCQKESPDKLIVVLDLDETLVCAYETSSLPTLIRSQAIEYGIKCFELECTSSDKEVDGKQKVNHVTVFERPGLHEFLQQTSEFADLILFTAGLEGYAKPLVDKIDVHKRFICRLYRPSTVATEHREHVKDLSCLTKEFSRIVLVDNNPFSFLLQPMNGIPCVPFSATQGGDNQLLGVILPLLKQLSLQEDVRPLLYETFHMPEWFQKHGIPLQLNQIL